jgi:hypothetical protein
VSRPLALLALIAGGLALLASSASAASAPQVKATWVTDVTATSANLRTEINPGGAATTYHFEYLTLAAYEANLKAAKDPFTGATKAPLSGSASVGAGSLAVERVQHVSGLTPTSVYRFRVVATNSLKTTTGPERSLGTEAPSNAFALLDNRGWEMVSPVDKNGGAIQAPEAIFGGGVFQAAANGQSLAYSSADSFGAGAQGAPAGSQYIATRNGGGWQTQNITTPLLAGSYGQSPDGVPYQLFSGDLSNGLLSNGQRCRGKVGECPVINPPLPGSGAVAGYRDYYLRSGDGSFKSLLSSADLAHTSLGPEQLEVDFVGASADLTHVVLSICAALSANAIEVAAPGGCAGQNLYESGEGSLRAINLLPGETKTTPGAVLAAPAGAISTDGKRVYVTQLEDGPIYLSEAGAPSKALPGTTGEVAAFQTASADGRYAFFTKGAHLYRYDATSGIATDLTPAGGVQGVLGTSADGSAVYYLDATGLMRWTQGTTTQLAGGANAAAPSSFPPATGTARVSPDGAHLLFLSTEELTGYENNGAMEVFLYGPPPTGGAPKLTCVSCNPTGERPQGASAIPGAVANGQGEAATRAYKPRALSANGQRVFFESTDDLSIQDSNNATDVYQWEAQGEGDCAREGGCTQLISSGRSSEASVFIDASADGSDAFFLTEASLAFGDPGSFDLYDARVGGGFPAPPNFIACDGDACQPLPEAPEDPTPGTLVANGGNPAQRFVKVSEGKKGKPHKPKGKHKKKHHKRHGGKKKHGGKK